MFILLTYKTQNVIFPVSGSMPSPRTRAGSRVPTLIHTSKHQLPYTVAFSATISGNHVIRKVGMEDSDDDIQVNLSRINTQAKVSEVLRYLNSHCVVKSP